MWVRFAAMVAVEAALVGAFALAGPGDFARLAPWLALTELAVSLAWWRLALADLALWEEASSERARARAAVFPTPDPDEKAPPRDLVLVPQLAAAGWFAALLAAIAVRGTI